MPYAEGRTYYDADSHIVELPDWIEQFAAPSVRKRIRPLALGGAGALAVEAVQAAASRRDDPSRALEAEARLMDAKGWSGLGAFDAGERSRALDLLGFETEPTLRDLPDRASDYVHRQLWFTPFPRDPVGWIIEQCGEDLLLFSSDYPHPEGTKDPIARFEETMLDTSDGAREAFYSGNYAAMMGWSTQPAA